MLLAVDTNVLARAMIDDGSEQCARSRRCFVENTVFVPDTVLVETEWLLRSRLNRSREDVNSLFSKLVATPTVVFRDGTHTANAVIAHRSGMDFADAMHLAAATHCDALASFDKNLIKRRGVLEGAVSVISP